jgi:putative Holliday junction resolvase
MQKSIDGHNKPKTSHILGIDFGAAKVGLALADSETRIAFAYGTIKNDKNFLAKLEEIIAKEGVGGIVLGRLGVLGGLGKSGVDTASIAKKIEGETGIRVEFQDEMFTTKMAQDNLIAKGARGIKKFDDQEAARIILQSWLDR